MTTTNPTYRLAIFNHKGGVGKTTLTVNIAAALAEAGKTILLVDSDPQCNVTSYLVESNVVDDLLDASDGSDGQTLWSALKPIVETTGPLARITPIETAITKLWLVPGDIQLSAFELELADYWASCLQAKFKGFVGTTALSTLIGRLARHHNVDYVFYDTGPNIGPLNRVILLDCDYFIVPGACDLFSVRALKTLGHSLHSWISDWRRIRQDAPQGAPLLAGLPKFLGYIPQRFRVYGHGMAKWPSRYHAQFSQHLYTDLMVPLKKLDPSLCPQPSAPKKLGEVKDFSLLVQKSQEQGVPLWQVDGGPDYQTQEARAAFSEIAKAIIRQTTTG